MLFPEERGTVTAELAIGIPSLLLVAGLVLGAIRWGVDAVAATSVAAETARSIAHGDDPNAAVSIAENAVPAAEWSAELTLDESCARAVLSAPVPLGTPVTVTQCVPR